MAYLVITEPGKEPYRHELKNATTFGRALDCDVCLHDARLSRRHCRVEPVDEKRGAWAIVDLQSRNGTRVGRAYVARHLLEDGAAIQLGQTSMRFHAAGFVAKRPEDPTSVATSEDAGEQVLEQLLSRAPARETAHLPQPMPRSGDRLTQEDAVPSSSMLSASDTTLDASRAMDASQTGSFSRPPARPHVREMAPQQLPADARHRKLAIIAVCVLIAMLVAAAVAWRLWK